MNVHLSPEQERIVNDQLKSGQFRSAEEVIAEALTALREREISQRADKNGQHEEAVRQMLSFVEKNRTPLRDVSVKQLIREGHRL
jgi:putative addiction module CopG family antidote